MYDTGRFDAPLELVIERPPLLAKSEQDVVGPRQAGARALWSGDGHPSAWRLLHFAAAGRVE